MKLLNFNKKLPEILKEVQDEFGDKYVYKDELNNPTLKWRGSENQRVIDVQKTLKYSEIFLFN